MDISRLRSLSRISILLCSIMGIYACDSGGGSDRGPVSVVASPTPFPTNVPGPSGPKVTPIPTLQLGAPTTKPIAIPPSSNKTNVQFISVVSGTYQPDELILDEVDANGTVVTLDVARLHDGGVDGDAFRGDRTYSGNVPVSSPTSVERLFRVRAVDDGINDDANIESGTGRFWISGCPVVARPSNPAKAMLDSRTNSFIFTDEVLVTFADDVAPDLDALNDILSAVGGRVVGCIPALRQFMVEIAENSTVDDVYVDIDTLLAIDTVIDATPNIQVLALIESEPELCDDQECQWYLDRIRAPQAWSLAGGGDEQRAVAVIDFGVDCTHAELPCDGNIFNEDLIDHGTGVAGLIGAKNDDGTDLVGVAWNTDLYPYSFLGKGGSQYKMSELITQSMSESSIRVINISAATALDPGDQILNSMCNAIGSGRLIVVAAGNAAKEDDCILEHIYPSQYNTEGLCSNGVDLASGLIVVGATDRDNNLAEWEGGLLCSNRSHVDIFAPGKDIYTSSGTDGYASKEGTSFASPLVAGSAAVLWAAEPSLTVKELHDQLVSSSAVLSQNASDDRFKTADAFLEGQNLLDLYSAVGGQEAAPVVTVVSPDAFAFNTESDAVLDVFITSNEVIITGFSSAAPIDIVGGFYSIDGAEFTSAAGLVSAGQRVELQVRSSTQPEELRSATLTIGDAIESFEVVTELPDTQADNFNFVNRKNAGLGSEVDSNILVIQGIDDGTAVTIEGGLYSIDGSDFTDLPGILNANQAIQIRVITSNTAETIHTATITIGGVSDSYTVETEITDSDPAPYSFAPRDDVDPNTIQFRDIVTVIDDNSLDTVEGLNVDTAISISGGLYSIDGGALRDDASTVRAGQAVRVLHTSANTFGSNAYTTLTIGSYSATFRSTTVANMAPSISNIQIVDDNGSTLMVGDTLSVTYEFDDQDGDLEGTHGYVWLRNSIAIVGAINSTYILTVADVDETITVSVTPNANGGDITGSAGESTGIDIPNAAPTVTDVVISGSTNIGSTLQGGYAYVDVEDDAESDSAYRWLRDGSEVATTQNYTLSIADAGQSLVFEVTPRAVSGTPTGVAVTSEPTLVPQAYAVSYAAGTGGSLSGEVAQVIASGSNATTVTAQADDGYTFVQWSDGVATASRADNNVIATISVSASFSVSTYIVTATVGAGGGVNTASQSVNHGQAASVTITPDEGYSIDTVTGCPGSIEGNLFTTGAITEACAISAIFVLDEVMPRRPDYDLDDDGLIEINLLEDLNEIRNHLDGAALYGESNGCPESGCIGFELTADLDFDSNADGTMDENDTYWNAGEGWEPLGGRFGQDAFTATLEGNGYRIDNLYINRPSGNYQGLFGYTRGATIRNLVLAGTLAQVQARSSVGSLVASADSTTINGVFSTVVVRSDYAFEVNIGGIVGIALESNFSALAYTGSVVTAGRYAGGILGWTYVTTRLDGSYATGAVRGLMSAGGLVGGDPGPSSVTAGYWAVDTSGQQTNTGGGSGVTLAELQCPIASDNEACANVTLYEGWDTYVDDEGVPYWDFGTASQLPALVLKGRTYRDSDGDGVFDDEDVYPNNFAATRDSDGDGFLDAWTVGCDNTCIANSGLEYDYFPNSIAVSQDDDHDDEADSWNENCDSVCQTASGIILDARLNDTDNDGETNDVDTDDNGDGVTDADADSDGLLDIANLSQLDAIRYNFKGSALHSDDTGINADSSGCPFAFIDGEPGFACSGYELMNDLDFDTNIDGEINENDSFWDEGEGWIPIGERSLTSGFSGTFEGNGYRIDNLYVNRPGTSSQGLFSYIQGATLRNLVLSGPLAQVRGGQYVGSLVGTARDSVVTGFYSSVAVRSDFVSSSYIGGLVGNSLNSSIDAVVYSGAVIASGVYAGGIVGRMDSDSSVTGSYTTAVIRETRVVLIGGIVGYSQVDITNSYWATDTSNQRASSRGGVGVTLAELQCPVAADNNDCPISLTDTLYEDWATYTDSNGSAYWDFGTASELPALILNGVTYRDSDGDGVLDEDDDFPNNYDASRDVDGDGYVDAWTIGCDNNCIASSSFEYDHFPESVSVARDFDLDGLADEWSLGCDVDCQLDSGITLDARPNDTNNDGVTNDDESGLFDADADSDGLLDISTLEELDLMRYNLAGLALQTDNTGNDADSSGCPYRFVDGRPTFACSGYELMADLDFDTNADGLMDVNDAYWNGAEGWEPVGGLEGRFTTVFEGNGYEIFNLYIDRPDSEHQALFGYTKGATVRNLVLTGSLSQVRGLDKVGSTIGYAHGNTTVEGVISTVPVISEDTSIARTGGLVGYLFDSTIRASFASGSVSAQGSNVGGLVGLIRGSSSVEASLSTGFVSSTSLYDSLVGGFYGVFYSNEGVVIANYWATDTSGQDSGGFVIGYTLAELQCPTASDYSACAEVALFEGWDAYLNAEGFPYWDFGTENELPGLDLGGFTHRDSDGNGILDADEVTP